MSRDVKGENFRMVVALKSFKSRSCGLMAWGC